MVGTGLVGWRKVGERESSVCLEMLVSHWVSEVTTPLLTSLHGSDAQLGLDFRV